MSVLQEMALRANQWGAVKTECDHVAVKMPTFVDRAVYCKTKEGVKKVEAIYIHLK
jgi:hypothetical protein